MLRREELELLAKCMQRGSCNAKKLDVDEQLIIFCCVVPNATVLSAPVCRPFLPVLSIRAEVDILILSGLVILPWTERALLCKFAGFTQCSWRSTVERFAVWPVKLLARPVTSNFWPRHLSQFSS